MIDWNATLYDPLFSTFGVSATITIGSADTVVTVIDQTAGIEINRNDVDLPVISPVAFVRATELDAASISENDLIDATLTISSNEWIIKNVAAKPGPDGKASGEYMLLLINGDL